jgi:transposase
LSTDEITAVLGRWEGYEITEVHRRGEWHGKGPVRIWITLKPVEGIRRVCSGCHRRVKGIHEVSERIVRDLPILGDHTFLRVGRVRVLCPRCGPKLEMVSWLGRYQRVTKRLAESVVQLCAHMSVKHVAEHFGLGWDTVKNIDKAYLKARLDPVDLSDVEALAMDEVSIRKRHRYATVFADPISGKVFWVVEGRKREDIRAFFELLGPEGCKRLKVVVMDMMSTYRQEVEAQCPQAEIVYDFFHIVSHYGRTVLDRIRVDEANRLRKDPAARKVIKGSKWLLLANKKNLERREDRIRLTELLAANWALMKAYVMREDLKRLWRYKYPKAARRFFDAWYRRAIYSKIEPLKRFARLMKKHLAHIIAHCRWPLHTNLLEGMNNKIKVIKRMAYGFRDNEYFFLKIRAAFPGNAG